jgi:uncharacterized protein with FMN-binding domain
MKSKAFISSALAIIGILLIGGIALYSNNGVVTMQTGSDITAGTPTTANTPPGTGTPVATSPYKDGTYTATGNYVSPGGKQAISVTVVLAGGKVADVTVTPAATDATSDKYQDKFVSGIKQQVVGKSIDALNVGVVSGSSLTAGGFNDALTKIKAQARA